MDQRHAASANTAWHFQGGLHQRGSVIIPLLLISTVVLIVAASLGSTAYSVLRGQQMKTARGSLDEVVENFRQCIFDGESWSQTVQDTKNTVLQCLQAGASGCPNEVPGPIRLRQIGGQEFCVDGYDSTDPASGFTATGQVCKGFSESGNPMCPYHFDFTWIPDCPPASTGVAPPSSCVRPTETVIIAAQFRPGPNAKIGRLNIGDGISREGYSAAATIGVTRINPIRLVAQDKYIVKGVPNLKLMWTPIETNTGRMPLILVERRAVGVSGGSCPPSGVVRRLVNYIQADPGLRVVSPIDSTSGIITLQPGTYDCTISAPSYQVGSFFVYLTKTGSTQPPYIRGSSTYASSALGVAQVRSVGAGRFTLPGPLPTAVELDEYCGPAPNVAVLNDLELGVPMGLGDEYYAQINCRTYNVDQ